MSQISFDSDALRKVPAAASAAGVAPGVIAYGLLQLWEWAHETRQEVCSDIHIAGFFGVPAGPALVVFGFLERVADGWRIRGAGKRLQARAAKSAGARNGRISSSTPQDILPKSARNGRISSSTPQDILESGAPKEDARQCVSAAASAGGNKSTSVSPELTSGAAPPPPPTEDPQENGAAATPARAVRARTRNEPSAEVPASAAGTPRSGTTEIQDPTPERPPPRALRVIDGGASDEPIFAPLSPDEEAALMAEAIAKQERLRAAHQADLAEKAEKRRLAGEAWKANEARKQAELDAYYERNPNGRGVPT